MDAATIRDGLQSHDRALYFKSGWIRDPYITLGPDDYYYLTGTQPNEDDPREAADPYNIGLGGESIVGDQVRVLDNGEIFIRAKDPAHRNPGPDEAQSFEIVD